jgi:predicted ribosome quality control (RQC) complex YloA/Tae2 family protein
MLYVEYLSHLVEDLSAKFVGSFLERVEQIDRTDFLLKFSFEKSSALFISLNQRDPFVEIKKIDPKVKIDTPILRRITSALLGAKLTGVKILDEDSLIEFSIQKLDAFYSKHDYSLIVELFKNNSNMILVENGKIIDAFLHHSLDTNHPIIDGMIYETPKNSGFKRVFEDKDRLYIADYLASIQDRALREKYKPIITAIKKRIKALNKKLDNLNEDKAKANENLRYKDIADSYLSELATHHRGEESFDYEDKLIPLVVNFTPSQNLEMLYKKYKKAKTTLVGIDEYLEETKREIDKLSTYLGELDYFNEYDYIDLIENLPDLRLSTKVKRQNKKAVLSSSPYYIIQKGVKIGFGKNEKQNNELTFKIAKKDDFFFHIKDESGPHVVIFSSSPSDELKELAAEIAIALIGREDGEVVSTKVGTLKKGKFLGQALLLSYESYRIHKFKYDIKTILLNASRF